MSPFDFAHLRTQALAQAQPSIQQDNALWIFGAGGFGQSMARACAMQGYKVAGFVETTPRSNTALALPVVDWQTLARQHGDAQIAMGIFNRGAAYDALVDIVTSQGFATPLMPWTLYERFGQALGWRYWLSPQQCLLDGLDRIARVGQKLADAQSVETLHRICAFRLGLDLPFSSVQSTDRQYFNALTLSPLLERSITYVDCGAYNGDTYADLLNQPGITCAQAFLLEPDPDNFALLVQHPALHKTSAACLPLAVSDTHRSLRFTVGQGEACALEQPGSSPEPDTAGLQVTAVSVDQLLPTSDLHLLKLDIEGGEASALRGAQQTILRNRPVLAVSLYHQPHDLWELPELLFELCPRYRFHIRQHGFNSFDAVLYAVPESA